MTEDIWSSGDNGLNKRSERRNLRLAGSSDRSIQLQQSFIISKKTNSNGIYSFFSADPDGTDISTIRPEGFPGPGMHSHDYFELLYVTEGELIQHIESGFYRYKKGDACLLNRNTRHFEESKEDYSVIFLHLSCKLIRELFEDGSSLAAENEMRVKSGEIFQFLFSNLNEQARYERDYLDFSATLKSIPPQGQRNEAGELLEAMVSELTGRRLGYSFLIKGLLLRLFGVLEDPAQFHVSHIRLDSSAEDFLFSRIRTLLEERHGRISRDELSRILNYNASYLNRIVKKHSGMSLLQLGRGYCMDEALRLLRETDESISNIIQKLGVRAGQKGRTRGGPQKG